MAPSAEVPKTAGSLLTHLLVLSVRYISQAHRHRNLTKLTLSLRRAAQAAIRF
jgi:hypothetical protein